jgi:hypothetical protein
MGPSAQQEKIIVFLIDNPIRVDIFTNVKHKSFSSDRMTKTP